MWTKAIMKQTVRQNALISKIFSQTAKACGHWGACVQFVLHLFLNLCDGVGRRFNKEMENADDAMIIWECSGDAQQNDMNKEWQCFQVKEQC